MKFLPDTSSEECFHTQRHARFDSGYTFMQQSTEAVGRVFHVSYVKGDSDLEVESCRVAQM